MMPRRKNVKRDGDSIEVLKAGLRSNILVIERNNFESLRELLSKVDSKISHVGIKGPNGTIEIELFRHNNRDMSVAGFYEQDCTLGSDVYLGRDCIVTQHSTVTGDVRIAEGAEIHMSKVVSSGKIEIYGAVISEVNIECNRLYIKEGSIEKP